MIRIVLLGCMLLLNADKAHAESYNHDLWDALLQENVVVLDGGKTTQVNYDGMLAKRSQLQTYLDSLATVSRKQFDSWDKDAQLAFLINVYNSWTVELILSKYPDLDSIKDLGSLFSSPWKKKIVSLFGEKHSLDDIEHDFIRGSDRYNDPRIHFAVNCASIGCPALRWESYSGEKLQEQLKEATALFLGDTSRNRLNGEVLEVSSIFKWYKEDFEKGWKGYETLTHFFADHAFALSLSTEQKADLVSGDIEIVYLKYDWKLNKVD